MDKQQREAFDKFNRACDALRAWVESNAGQENEIPDALIDAVVNAEQAYQATRQLAPAPEARHA